MSRGIFAPACPLGSTLSSRRTGGLAEDPHQTAYNRKDVVHTEGSINDRSAGLIMPHWVADIYKHSLADVIGDKLVPDMTVTVGAPSPTHSHDDHEGYTMRLYFWLVTKLEIVEPEKNEAEETRDQGEEEGEEDGLD